MDNMLKIEQETTPAGLPEGGQSQIGARQGENSDFRFQIADLTGGKTGMAGAGKNKHDG